MAYELKEGQGSLFRNDKRRTDKSPEYTGRIKGLDGNEYRLAAWVKEGKSGTKFFSIQMSHPKPEGEKEEAPAEKLDDEIPF